MFFLNNNNKYQQMANYFQGKKDEKSRNYFVKHKNRNTLKQYTKLYKNYIFIQGLNTNYSKSEAIISLNNKIT